MLGSDEGVKLVVSNGEVIGTILENLDVIIPGIYFVTYLKHFGRSFDGANYVKL